MSEVDNQNNEEQLDIDPTMDLVNALQVGNFNAADTLFKDILADRVQSTLDAEKIAVAGQIFNGEPDYEEDFDDDEEDDEVSEEEEDLEVE